MHVERIRTFFALELPVNVQRDIFDFMQQIKPLAPNTIKWVSQENLHITLKFLGMFNPEQVNFLQTRLQQELFNFQPFVINLDSIGFFPNSKFPKVIWLGINHSEAVINLVQIISKATSYFGYPNENRTFHAHITLGRTRQVINNKEIDSLKRHILENKIPEGQITIGEVLFIQSDLKNTGPVYRCLFSIIL